MFEMGVFGTVIGRIWVVEFQKRGLPHAHMLLILDEGSRPVEPADFDRFVCAELPDPRTDPELFETVTRCMIHGPCGPANPNASCMVDGRCSKGYPKEFREETTIDEVTGYPLYRRRNNSVMVEIGGHVIDNRWVVPYSPVLSKIFNAHINVEICASPGGLKYLFKYVYKGPDRAEIAIAQGTEVQGEAGQVEVVDEITRYLDVRYITLHEACWKIFYYPLHQERPCVVRLQVHLEDEQMVTFNENDDLQYVVDNAANKDTTLTAWFKANEKYPWANQYTYAAFPKYFVWHKNTREWTPRTRGDAVGRIYSVPHIVKERFYLRMLLYIVCGARGFQDMRAVDGVVCADYKDACFRRGLLQDNREWDITLHEASTFQSGRQLRSLFATILIFCEVTDPVALWERHYESLMDDIAHRSRVDGLNLSDDEIKNIALRHVDSIAPARQVTCGLSADACSAPGHR